MDVAVLVLEGGHVLTVYLQDRRIARFQLVDRLRFARQIAADQVLRDGLEPSISMR
jgi:hypothetical protein